MGVRNVKVVFLTAAIAASAAGLLAGSGCESGTCDDDGTCGAPPGAVCHENPETGFNVCLLPDGSVEGSVERPDGKSDGSGGDAVARDGSEVGSDGNAPDVPSLSCSAPTSLECNGACVDPTLPAHCGTCDHACSGPEAGTGMAVCSNGQCSVECDGTTTLDCNGTCYDPLDTNHCGSCSNACTAPANGTATCTAGADGGPNCGFFCVGPYHACQDTCDPNTDTPSDTNDPCVLSAVPGVFVSNGGSDTNGAGTASNPYATITKALANLGTTGRVYVCDGTYNEQVTITAAVSIFGGLSCTGGAWSYAAGTQASVTGPENQPALVINAGSSAVDIEDMSFTSPAASGQDGSGNGLSSLAALVKASTDVSFERCALTAGAGANGLQTKPATTPNYSDGTTAPPGSTNSGGTGGNGGQAVCVADTSSGGAGGTVGMNSDKAGNGTSNPTATLNPATLNSPYDGLGGAQGAAGDDGASGTGGGAGGPAASYGTLTASGWTPSGGLQGGVGNPGQGGGGEGAKGANGGAGGGAGGCGGAGAPGGAGGGASIALASFASAITLDNGCTLTVAAGGSGQPGGDGQPGQAGGAPGATLVGGSGGNGGGGGGGGGGTGGLSVCIAYTTTAPTTNSAHCSPGSAGQPGPGGAANVGGDNGDLNPGGSGTAGAGGLSAAGVTSPLEVQ